jgi:hypothetical protein
LWGKLLLPRIAPSGIAQRYSGLMLATRITLPHFLSPQASCGASRRGLILRSQEPARVLVKPDDRQSKTFHAEPFAGDLFVVARLRLSEFGNRR